MISSEFSVDLQPTRLIFGRGSWSRLPAELQRLGRRAVVLTSAGLSGQGDRIEELESCLRRTGFHIEVHAVVRPNPDLADLKPIATSAQFDVVVGVGGGSALDSAKVLGLGLAQHADLTARIPPVDGEGHRVPTVLIPTTAGTGSETSVGAIMSSRDRGWKGGVRGTSLAATVALVDPDLTTTMPTRLTALTGFDILTHAVESFVSKRATAHSRAISMHAVQAIGYHLPRVIAGEGDPSHRAALSYWSAMMGLNLRSVGTALPHRMQYPVGGLYPGIAHAECLAWLYPPWLERLHATKPQDVEDLLYALSGTRPHDAIESRRMIRDWLQSIGLDTAANPCVQTDHAELVSRIEGNLAADPLDDPLAHALEIYQEVF